VSRPSRSRRRENDEDEDTPSWNVRRENREYAESRTQGPGRVLQVYGGFLILVAAGLFFMAIYGMVQLSNSTRMPLSTSAHEEATAMTVIGGMGSLCLGVLGGLIWLGGTRMKALRSYGLALTATILTFVTGLPICILLTAIGIWPLIVLCDTAVREQFE
jgi:hypothetical protein